MKKQKHLEKAPVRSALKTVSICCSRMVASLEPNDLWNAF